MIQFQCPHCGKRIQVDDVHGGKRGACPACKQVIDIPAAPDAGVPGLVPAAPQPPAGGVPGDSPSPAAVNQPAGGPPPVAGAAGAGGGKKRISGKSIAALICGLLGCLGITAVAAIILGILGIRDVNRNKGQVGGMGMAVAGLVLGCLFGLVFLGVIAAGGALFPAVMSARDAQQRVQCMNNLKCIGMNLKTYAAMNRGNRYPTLYSKEGDPKRPQETWGGPAAWDRGTWALKDRGDEDMELEDHGPFTCNLHCLWLIVRDGMSDPRVFVCPRDSNVSEDDVEEVGQDSWWDFERLTHCSYSYQNQLGRAMTEGSAYPSVPIMADKSPGRPDVNDKPSGPEGRKPWYLWNSPNHDWKGQNVLYGDGHVEWTTEPTCGHDGNNIWIKETWNPATRTWAPDGPTKYDRYGEGLSHRRDTWLVP